MAGDATTTLPVVVFKPEEGVQVYTVEPVAISVTDEPAQSVAVCGLTAMVGVESTLTVAIAVFVQIPIAPVTV
jgi:hypothetical protein